MFEAMMGVLVSGVSGWGDKTFVFLFFLPGATV